MNKLRVFTSFSGYDSQCLALDRLGIDYELVGWSEIDKYAIQAHNALYPQWADRNNGDISKIDWAQVPDFDLFTYSSPCQDFSQAGLQRGGEAGSGTRSSLLWECERAIAAKRPKYLLMENVSALVSQKFIKLFNRWQLVLQGYGYKNFAKVLNAKDYGVPQNRERIFLVSILDDEARYEFPQPYTLEKRLKDVLEQNADERYYLSEKALSGLLRFNKEREEKGQGFRWEPKSGSDIRAAVLTTAGSRPCDNYITEPCVQQIGCIYDNNAQVGRVYDTKGISPTLDDMSSGGSKEPKIALKEQSIITPSHGYFEGAENTETSPCVKVSAMQGQNFVKEQTVLNSDADGNAKLEPYDCIYYNQSSDFQRPPLKDIGRTIKADSHQPAVATPCEQGIRVRKLTERELFRLMDVSEPDIDILLNAGISKTQLAKMAGNSIVVNVLYHIFDRMFIHTEPTEAQLRLF